ncbi:MAG: hypothetical protein AAB372_01045 [Patescibacteria group bacterium]
MPILHVYGVPHAEGINPYLRDVVRPRLVRDILDVVELGLSEPSQVSIFFHKEDYELGPNRSQREVIAEVRWFLEVEGRRMDAPFHKLADAIGRALGEIFVRDAVPQIFRVARVECHVWMAESSQGYAEY